MTHRDWAQSETYDKMADTFEALIIGAMRKATLPQRGRLRLAFPRIFDEALERDHMPDGYYQGEPHDEDLTPASNDDTDPFTERQADRDNAPPAGTGQRREDQPGYR